MGLGLWDVALGFAGLGVLWFGPCDSGMLRWEGLLCHARWGWGRNSKRVLVAESDHVPCQYLNNHGK